MKSEKDDTFLSRWLQNQLSDKERKEFEASADFAHYQKLLKATDRIKSPAFDEEVTLARIKAGRGAKVVSMSPNRLWTYGIAASIVLLLGFFLLFQQLPGSPEKVLTGFGEQKTILLPDGSEMILNAKSQAVYYPKRWAKKRKLNLEGEGFFSVEKGATFEVETTQGVVTVLGTMFNVRSINDYFEVTCSEGKVRVSMGKEEYILTSGMKFSVGKNLKAEVSNEAVSKPAWLSGKSTFTSVPIAVILEALQNQYNIEFTGKIPLENQLFTGSFPHDNLQVALQVVFEPLQLRYQIKGDRTVELQD